MTYYNLIKLAEDSDRETHTGKVLSGLGLAGAGEYVRRTSNRMVDSADIYDKALKGAVSSQGSEEIKNLYKGKTGKELTQEASDALRKSGVFGRKAGYGLLGAGALLGGYGAYKNYQASKNDPIHMPSDATIRRHMKASEF